MKTSPLKFVKKMPILFFLIFHFVSCNSLNEKKYPNNNAVTEEDKNTILQDSGSIILNDKEYNFSDSELTKDRSSNFMENCLQSIRISYGGLQGLRPGQKKEIYVFGQCLSRFENDYDIIWVLDLPFSKRVEYDVDRLKDLFFSKFDNSLLIKNFNTYVLDSRNSLDLLASILKNLKIKISHLSPRIGVIK